jgi:hypothetical protein
VATNPRLRGVGKSSIPGGGESTADSGRFIGDAGVPAGGTDVARQREYSYRAEPEGTTRVGRDLRRCAAAAGGGRRGKEEELNVPSRQCRERDGIRPCIASPNGELGVSAARIRLARNFFYIGSDTVSQLVLFLLQPKKTTIIKGSMRYLLEMH